jgi:hypothetical protein
MADQEKLVLKNAPSILAMDKAADVATLTVPIMGLIDAKDGKTTHVVTSGTLQVVRSDGKIITLMVNAYYK